MICVHLYYDKISLFSVVVFALCHFELQGTNGIISVDSTKFTECSWRITSPPHHKVRLTFSILNLVIGQLRVYDGQSANVTLLGQFSWITRPFSVQSTARFMFVTLKMRVWHFLSLEGKYIASTEIG